MKTASMMGLFLIGIMAGCSSEPPLSEGEFLKILGEASHAPYQFKERTWPLLKDRTLTYCGELEQVTAAGEGSRITMKVEKTYAGKKLPWSLEGKADSPALAHSYQSGNSLCITGVLESYSARAMGEEYWGYVRILSWARPAT